MSRKTRPRGRHLILVGIRGSGKTTVGRRLAARTGARFLDTDDLVEEALGLPILQIFERLGQAVFRQVERDVIADISKQEEACVVATGGGVVLARENRVALKTSGLVVWLDLPVEIAAGRISQSNRPSLTGKPITEELRSIAAERQPLYEEVADEILDASLPADWVARSLEELWMKG